MYYRCLATFYESFSMFLQYFCCLNILNMTKSDSSKKSSIKNIPKKAMSKPKLNNATLRKRLRFKPGADLSGKVK